MNKSVFLPGRRLWNRSGTQDGGGPLWEGKPRPRWKACQQWYGPSCGPGASLSPSDLNPALLIHSSVNSPIHQRTWEDPLLLMPLVTGPLTASLIVDPEAALWPGSSLTPPWSRGSFSRPGIYHGPGRNIHRDLVTANPIPPLMMDPRFADLEVLPMLSRSSAVQPQSWSGSHLLRDLAARCPCTTW